MATVTVDELQIRVSGSSTNAYAAVDALIGALEKLQRIRFNDNIARSINNIGKAAENASKKANKMASAFAEAMSNANKYAMTLKNYDWNYGKAPTGDVVNNNFPRISMQDIAPNADIIDAEYEEVYEEIKMISQKATPLLLTMAKDTVTGFNEPIPVMQRFEGILEKAGKTIKSVGDKASKSLKKGMDGLGKAFESPIKKISHLTSAFGRIMLYRAIRSVIKSIGEAFSEGTNNIYQFSKAAGGAFSQNMDACASALATFKNSIGAAVAPLINALTPAFVSICNWATAAANAVARFLAILSGKGTYTKAIAYTKEYAEATAGAAGAASEAAKDLSAGIDELNVLNDKASSGGGAGSSIPDYSSMFENVDVGKVPDWLSSLKLTLDDVFFEWDNLNPEQIAEKIIVGLMALVGLVAGLSLTGTLGGGLIFAIAGAALGIAIDTLTFNHDGKLDAEEIAKLISIGLWGTAGAVIGAGFGGVAGATLGFLLGSSVGLLINELYFKDKQFGAKELAKSASAALKVLGGGIGFFVGGGLSGALLGVTIASVIDASIKGIKFDSQGKVDTRSMAYSIAKIVAAIAGGVAVTVLTGGSLGVAGFALGMSIPFVIELAIQKLTPVLAPDSTIVAPAAEKAGLKVANGSNATYKQAQDEAEEFVDGYGQILKTLEYTANDVSTGIETSASTTFSSLSRYGTLTKDALGEATSGMKTTTENDFLGISKTVEESMGVVQQTIENHSMLSQEAVAQHLGKAATEAGEKIAEIKTVTSTSWSDIKDTTVSDWQLIQATVSTVWATLDGLAKERFESIKKYVTDAWKAIDDDTKLKWTQEKGTITSTLTKALNDTLLKFKEVFKDDGNVQTMVGDAFTTMETAIKTSTDNAYQSIDSFVTKSIERFEALIAEIERYNAAEASAGVDAEITISPKGYASGGLVSNGELFLARESGPELVGSVGGSTAVMNNDQIVSAVSSGVYSAVVSAMGQNNGDKAIYVYLDGKQIEASTRTTKQRRGASIATGGVINYA